MTTIKSMTKLHKMVNEHYFEGSLTTPGLLITDNLIVDGDKCWGCYYPESRIIAIEECNHWIRVFIHEMIHQFIDEWYFKDTKTHGKLFRIWAKFFENEFNYKKDFILHTWEDI